MSKSNPRNIKVTFRLTAVEYDLLMGWLQRRGMKLSKYLRLLIKKDSGIGPTHHN